MESFVYENPVIVVFGEGRLNEIGQVVCEYGKNALVVTYQDASFFSKVIGQIKESLLQAGVSCTVYEGVTANPLLSQARAGIAICKAKNIDIIIGLGGGSVMDCSKVIAAGVYYDRDIKDMIAFSHSEITQIPPKKALPTVMIPTLPATGSEMNSTAVITEDESSKKSYVWTPCLYPKATILDPNLTLSLPPYQTACGAFDIISHVIEAYLNGLPGMNLELQDRMQEGVVKAVLETLPMVTAHPEDVQARGVLMWAASIALNGWLTSGTFGFTPMHQMGHVLSGKYGATHGATLACMMPAWMRYFSKREDKQKYVQLAERIFDTSDLEEAADKFETMMMEYGVQTRISLFGVKEEDLDELADRVVSVSFGPDGLLNGRPKMSREDIRAIYKIAL